MKLDPNGSHLWSRDFAGSGTTQAASTVDFDQEGRVVLAGAFNGTLDFGGGPLDGPSDLLNIFVAQFDPEGLHLASAKYGNSNNSSTFGTALDPDGNVLITGIFNYHVDFGGGTLAASDFRATYLAKLSVPPAVTVRLNGEDPPNGIPLHG